MALGGRLHIDLVNPLEGVDEEGVDGDEAAGVIDIAFAELDREAFEQLDLLLREGGSGASRSPSAA